MKNKRKNQTMNENQVNNKPKKPKKKKWLWISLGIGLISIVVIVTIIVSLSQRKNPYFTPFPSHEGVHYDNFTEKNGMIVAHFACYSIDIEKDQYEYNEEFIIKYTIEGYGSYFITDRNNLNFKIVSDEFEILSPTEYHFDLDTDVSIYGNILSFGEEYEDSIYPIEMELKVKAKEPSEYADEIKMNSILFLYEYPLEEDFKDILVKSYDIGETYQFSQDEFTKDFEWIHRFYYLNDEFGTLLVDDGKRHEYYDETYKKISSLLDYYVTPYKSLNRLYEKELITKKDYLDRLIGYLTDYKTGANMRIYGAIVNGVVENNKAYMVYTSKNMRAYFKWRPEYLELHDKYFVPNGEPREEFAKVLVRMLYENALISFEQYTAEIQLIEEEGIQSKTRKGEYEEAFISFEVPMDLYYDFIVE